MRAFLFVSFCLIFGVAHAQDILTAVPADNVVVPVEPTSWWQVLIAQFQAPLTAAVTGLIGIVVTWVGAKLVPYIGQATTEKLMNIFQTAAQNAAAWLINKYGLQAALDMKPGDSKLSDAVKTQIDDSIPGTLKKLGGPSDKLKGDKVLAWIQKIAMGGLQGGIPGAVGGALGGLGKK